MERLKGLEVNNGMFIDYESARSLHDLDAVLSSHGSEAWATLTSILGEQPISAFVEDQLVRGLDKFYGYDSDAVPALLLSFGKLGDAESLSEQLISDLESLPWQYSFFVQLPSEVSEPSLVALNSEVFQLSERAWLIPATPSLDECFPNPGSFSSFPGILGHNLFGSGEKWPESGYFLRYVASGYILRSESGPTFESVTNWYRAAGGFALAQHLVQKGYEYFSHQPAVKLSVFRQFDERWQYQETKPFPIDFSNCFLRMRISDWITNVPEATANLFTRAGWNFVRKGLQQAESSERILRAAQWFFDSYSSQSELLGFVQATVVLEILLGDKAVSDIIGLSELLRNRCAYLIGKDAKERKAIMDDFNRIYSTRSKIVHAGKNSLSRAEVEDLWTLREICSRVIEKEVGMHSLKPKI